MSDRAMKLVAHNESFLLSQFREFYTEVIRLKQLVKSNGWVAPADTGPDENDPAAQEPGTWVYFPEVFARTPQANGKTETVTINGSPPAGAAIPDPLSMQPSITDQTKVSLLVWQSLLALFRRNAMDVLRAGGSPTDRYFEAQYVMAAFADEVFIHMDWEGNRAWRSNLLESTLFQTHIAGEQFFEKLDRLLRDKDPADRSLAAVYLTAMSLGFRGKYHGVNDRGALRRYREELFTFLFQRPSDLSGESKIAFPESYLQNLKREPKKKLTNPRLWVGVLCIVLVTYLLASHGIWLSLTYRLEAATGKIVEIENRLSTIPVKQ